MYVVSKLWKNISESLKNSSSTPKSQSNEFFLLVECDKSPPSNNSSKFKISSSTPNSKSNALNETTKLREEGKKHNEQKSEFVRVDGILKLKKNLKK